MFTGKHYFDIGRRRVGPIRPLRVAVLTPRQRHLRGAQRVRWLQQLVHRGAHILTLTLPWFGYQTMERAVKPGEVVTAKTRALMADSTTDLDVEIEVLRDRLEREGVHLETRDLA